MFYFVLLKQFNQDCVIDIPAVIEEVTDPSPLFAGVESRRCQIYRKYDQAVPPRISWILRYGNVAGDFLLSFDKRPL